MIVDDIKWEDDPFQGNVISLYRELSSDVTDVCVSWHGVGGRVCHTPWPLEALPRPGEQHVTDEGLYRGLAHQPDEEELLYHGGGHRPQGGQPQQQLAEPGGLVGVLGPAVFLQRALGLFLKLLNCPRLCEATRVYNERKSVIIQESANTMWWIQRELFAFLCYCCRKPVFQLYCMARILMHILKSDPSAQIASITMRKTW